MIWLWRIPDHWHDKRIGEYIKNTGTDRFELRKAMLLNGNLVTCPKIVFHCDEKYLADVLPNSGALLIVSHKVLTILNEVCRDDYQQFEANVYVNGRKIKGYHLLNVVNALHVIDKEKSEFETMSNSSHILKFNKIVYKTEDISPHDIVRNADYYSHVLVSDKLKSALEKERIRGVDFRLEP